jgi:hypothetical protein
MMGQPTMMVKRTLLMLTAMLAALVLASGVAFAVNKVCPSGTTQQNPCLGTAKSKKASGKDTLIGTSGPDWIKALSGNDQISGDQGNDNTDGGSGNDTYSYKDGWGQDTVIDASGTDALNFSAMGSVGGVYANLSDENSANHFVQGPNGERVDFPSGSVIEKVTGSSRGDMIFTGGATNTLQPGPGTGDAHLFEDYGGDSGIPVSSDTYSGFAASGGYGQVEITDHGGTTDKLVLPFASTAVYFEAWNSDSDPAADSLVIMTSSTDYFYIWGQLEPDGSKKGHIEQIQFTDGTLSIGSETPQAQTLSAASATKTSAEARVAALNEASSLDAAEKEKLSEAAKKIIAEAQKKKAQDNDKKPSPSSAENKR